MSGFYEYTALSEEQLERLEGTLESAAVKGLLRELLLSATERGLGDCKVGILVDFYFHHYAYCKAQAFSARQTCSMLSIAQHVFRSDMDNATSSAESSFSAFEKLILRRAVERPPVSMQVFSEEQALGIVDHFLNSYFRHFRLYKYIFSERIIYVLNQVLPHEVEYATPKLHALDAGIFVAK